MAGGAGHGANRDYSKAFSDNPDVAKDIDFDKQVKKPKQIVPGEQIIEGVTHDSIKDYMEARQAAESSPEPKLGLMSQARKILRRS